jgi:hypothetical protein
VICNTQRTANADGCWTSLHPQGTIMPFILCRCTSRDHVYADRFLGLLPLIWEQASLVLRKDFPDRREELIADVIANGWGAAYGLRAEGCQPSYAAGQTLACLRS